jgi:hypothetical protein
MVWPWILGQLCFTKIKRAPLVLTVSLRVHLRRPWPRAWRAGAGDAVEHYVNRIHRPPAEGEHVVGVYHDPGNSAQSYAKMQSPGRTNLQLDLFPVLKLERVSRGWERKVMPYVDATEAKLNFEESGYGYPIIFIHEIRIGRPRMGNQVRHFSRA